MTAALRREQITFPGAGMTLDWIPGAGLAVAGGALSLWRSAVVTEEKVRVLKEEITRVESDSRAFQESIHADFRDTLEKLNNVVTQMLVNIARQIVNSIAPAPKRWRVSAHESKITIRS